MAMNTADLPHNLMAFVTDPISEQAITNVIKEANLSYAEVKQGSIADVIEFMKTCRTPKVLLVDISNSDLPISDITKIKEFSAPSVSIIVVGARNDVGLFRDLLSIGVTEYIVKPLSTPILRKTLEDTLNSKKTFIEKKGKLINIMSSVGGAGATTIATNVSILLANANFKRTLLMDMDFLFGTTNLLLDLKAENAYLDILESSDKVDDYFIETILRKYSNRLYYLGGLCDLIRGVVVDLEAFATLMKTVKKQFNYVILDSQREVSGVTKAGIIESDIFAIVSEMSLASAQNTARLIEYFSTDQAGKKVVVIANKVGMSNGALSREAFEKVIGQKINFMIPFDRISTLASANIGQPIVNSDGPMTEILESIVDEILGKNDSRVIEKEVGKKEEKMDFDKIKEKIWDLISKIK